MISSAWCWYNSILWDIADIMNNKSFIRKRCAIIDDRKAILQIQISFYHQQIKRGKINLVYVPKINVSLCVFYRWIQILWSVPQYWIILKSLFLSKFNSTPDDGVKMYQALVVDTFWFIIDFLKEQRFSMKLRYNSLTEWKNINLIYSKFDSQILE